MASLVELLLDNDERLGSVCDPLGLHLVHRQRLTEEVVEVERPLVDQRVGLCCWVLFKLHDFRVGWSRRLVSPRARGGQTITGLFCPIVVSRGLVLIAGEDAHMHRLSGGCCFRKCVGHLIEVPRDVIELEAIELVFQP